MYRWAIITKWFSVRMHKWVAQEHNPEHYHNHSWDFCVFCFKGGYVDKTPEGSEVVKRWEWYYRPKDHTHTVQLTHSPTWTVIITGKFTQVFKFFAPRKDGTYRWWKRNKYFLEHGHTDCPFDDKDYEKHLRY